MSRATRCWRRNLAYLAYETVATDIARRLRRHADELHAVNPLSVAPPGIRYAANLVERWGIR
ncbi:hypothetical protein KMT30_07790 [Streptomyces sp. IBSBF 2953]|nr:hypothetical protein [Streptomyces hayashii]